MILYFSLERGIIQFSTQYMQHMRNPRGKVGSCDMERSYDKGLVTSREKKSFQDVRHHGVIASPHSEFDKASYLMVITVFNWYTTKTGGAGYEQGC